jgi:hypothetical protein
MRAITQPSIGKKLAVTALAIVIISAGGCSFLFRNEWLWWGSLSKVLIYTLLSVATSFTVTFSWVDIITFFHDLAKRREYGTSHKWGLVESPIQVWLVVTLSIITGLTYGLIFGLVQLDELTEKHHSRQRLYHSLGRTELFSLPFGAVLGGMGAVLNEWLRYRNMVNSVKKDIEYKPLTSSDMDGI